MLAFFIPGYSQFDNLEKLIRRPPRARLKECRPCTHPDPYQQPRPWTIAIKFLTKSRPLSRPPPPAQVGTQSFWGMSPLCPPLPGKAVKLIFSTSPKTSSLRFNSAPVHRGWIFGIISHIHWSIAQLLYHGCSNASHSWIQSPHGPGAAVWNWASCHLSQGDWGTEYGRHWSEHSPSSY